MKEHKLRVSESKAFRKIPGVKMDEGNRKFGMLQNEEFCGLCMSHSTTKINQGYDGLGWRQQEMHSEFLVKKNTWESSPLEDQERNVNIRVRWTAV
jgi:hypothetical protein